MFEIFGRLSLPNPTSPLCKLPNWTCGGQIIIV